MIMAIAGRPSWAPDVFRPNLQQPACHRPAGLAGDRDHVGGGLDVG